MELRTEPRPSSGFNYLIGAAAFVIVVAGMRASVSILVPFLLAAFVAVICAPSLFWLRRKGVPTALAMLAVVAGVLAIALAMAALVGSSLNEFSRDLPFYQDRLCPAGPVHRPGRTPRRCAISS